MSSGHSSASTRALILFLGVVALFLGGAVLFRISADVGSRLWGTPIVVQRAAQSPPFALTAGTSSVTLRSASLIIAGDIADCADLAPARKTAELVAGMRGVVMTAGDNAYVRGTTEEFADCYQPTWGRFLERTRAVPGNHDYGTAGAAGYFEYFGERAGPPGRGYYTFSVGGWPVHALSSELCVSQGCEPGSEQYEWLAATLGAQRARCSIAVLHHPLYGSGRYGGTEQVRPLVELLYGDGVDIVVSGHEHDYERLYPSRPDGSRDRRHGIRQFIVGTGGTALRAHRGRPVAQSAVLDSSTHGVLRLRLHPQAYDWEFVPADEGGFSDRGSARCHERPD